MVHHPSGDTQANLFSNVIERLGESCCASTVAARRRRCLTHLPPRGHVPAAMYSLQGKSVLVTGGTGSFGKRFIATALERLELARLVVFSRDELKQFEMQQ